MMKRLPKATVLTIFAMLFARGAIAQPVEPDQTALDAFKEAWEAGASWTPLEGQVYRWRREVYSSRTAEELNRLESEIQDIPEHPGWQRLRVERQMLDAGPATSEVEVWLQAPGQYRLCDSPSRPGAPYVDFVVTPNIIFCLTPNQLTILEPGRPPPRGRSFIDTEGDLLIALRRFATGALGGAEYSAFTPVSARFNGTALHGVAHATSGAQFEFRIEDWNSTLPVVTSIQAVPATNGPQARVGPRIQDGAMPSGVASTYEVVLPNGRLLEKLTWLGSRPMAEGEFANACRIPEPGSTDIIRGPVTFTAVYDYRDEAGTITDLRTPDRPKVAIPGHQVDSPHSDWLTIVGWVAAGLVISMLVGIRAWQKRALNLKKG